jgi:hypothetical protein
MARIAAIAIQLWSTYLTRANAVNNSGPAIEKAIALKIAIFINIEWNIGSALARTFAVSLLEKFLFAPSRAARIIKVSISLSDVKISFAQSSF